MYDTRSIYHVEPRTNPASCVAIEKMLSLFNIPHIRAPHALSYEVNPTKQVLPGKTASWDQAIQLNNTHSTRTLGRRPENQGLAWTT